jgi:hypothetical protein
MFAKVHGFCLQAVNHQANTFQPIHHTGCFCSDNFADFIKRASLKAQVGVISITKISTKYQGFTEILL